MVAKGLWGDRIGPGDPKNTPRRGGGSPVLPPRAGVTPSVPHHPRSSVGARGYLLIFTEAAAPGEAAGGEGVCSLFIGFLFVFQRMGEKEKKKKLPQPSPGCGTWDSAAGGDR